MLRKIIKVLSGFLMVSLLISVGFFIFGLYLTRKLPWQHPAFDTVLPADPGLIGEKGVLVFSKTNGFHHSSIESAMTALEKAGKKQGWDIRFTESGTPLNNSSQSKFWIT